MCVFVRQVVEGEDARRRQMNATMLTGMGMEGGGSANDDGGRRMMMREAGATGFGRLVLCPVVRPTHPFASIAAYTLHCG